MFWAVTRFCDTRVTKTRLWAARAKRQPPGPPALSLFPRFATFPNSRFSFLISHFPSQLRIGKAGRRNPFPSPKTRPKKGSDAPALVCSSPSTTAPARNNAVARDTGDSTRSVAPVAPPNAIRARASHLVERRISHPGSLSPLLAAQSLSLFCPSRFFSTYQRYLGAFFSTRDPVRA